MNIHVLQHVPLSTGAIEDWIQENNYSKTSTKLYENTDFPDIETFDFLIILGGPMGAYDETDYPWLVKEKEFIYRAIEAKKKILGICLGSQLLADVLGGKVYKNDKKELGWLPVFLTPEGENCYLTEDFEPVLTVFQFHGDTFTLPENTVRLWKSDICINQGFLYKDHVLGLQFHLEATPESVTSLLEKDSYFLSEPSETVQSKSEILENISLSYKTKEILYTLLEKFLNHRV